MPPTRGLAGQVRGIFVDRQRALEGAYQAGVTESVTQQVTKRTGPPTGPIAQACLSGLTLICCPRSCPLSAPNSHYDDLRSISIRWVKLLRRSRRVFSIWIKLLSKRVLIEKIDDHMLQQRSRAPRHDPGGSRVAITNYYLKHTMHWPRMRARLLFIPTVVVGAF